MSSCFPFPACARKTWRRCRICRGWWRAATGRRSCRAFPCVTWPVQANMLTGKLPAEHGVIANGFYWRDKQRSRDVDGLERQRSSSRRFGTCCTSTTRDLTSAVWFPMLSKGCGADYICMPAPIHNPDGSESLWCYTKPVELYGTLRDAFGHFPLMNFWGPMANIKSTAWIADSAVLGDAASTGRTSSTSTCRISTTPRRRPAPTAQPAQQGGGGAGRSARASWSSGCTSMRPTASSETWCGWSPASTSSRRSIT